MMHFQTGLAVVAFLSASMTSTACAASNSASLAFAYGNKTQLVRFGMTHDWNRHWARYNNLKIVHYWDVSLAYWKGLRYRGVHNSTQNIADFGITPVFRMERENELGPYAEAGLGVHLLSKLYDNNGRRFSTNLEFGTHLGFGYVFANKLDFALRIEHFSNGGIRQPNSGANFTVLRIARSF